MGRYCLTRHGRFNKFSRPPISFVNVVTLYGWRPGNNEVQDTADTVTMLETMMTRTVLVYPDMVAMVQWCVCGQCLARTGERSSGITWSVAQVRYIIYI